VSRAKGLRQRTESSTNRHARMKKTLRVSFGQQVLPLEVIGDGQAPGGLVKFLRLPLIRAADLRIGVLGDIVLVE
jgi:hypothetical protein